MFVEYDSNPAASPATRWERLLAWEHAMVERWQRVPFPNRLNRFLVAFIRLGDGWAWGLVGLALFTSMSWPQFRAVLSQALLAVAISLPMYWGLKLGLRRPRPFVVQGGSPRVPPLDKYSFPSGHTMNNLAVAMTLAMYIPALWIPAVLVPISLGILRVFYGVHFLSDILAGALLGALSSVGAQWVFPHVFH